MSSYKTSLTHLVVSGHDITYGPLTLANIRGARNFDTNKIYQVHCDRRGLEYSFLFEDPSVAVDKFVGIKNQLG